MGESKAGKVVVQSWQDEMLLSELQLGYQARVEEAHFAGKNLGGYRI